MLIAHENASQRVYLGEIIQAAGAIIAGPIDAYADGISLLNGELRIHAMVISQMLPYQDAVALLDAAIDNNVRTVIVYPRQVGVKSPFSDYKCLEAHIAGFQIVEAIAGMLAITRGCIHHSARMRV